MRVKDMMTRRRLQSVKLGYNAKSSLEVYTKVLKEVIAALEESTSGRHPSRVEEGRPTGELIEIADIILFLMDYCESKGMDLEEALEAKHRFNGKGLY